MASQKDQKRRFWIVSPNVNNNKQTVPDWRQASLVHRAAFMGYSSDDREHKDIGYKFAHEIRQNDVILIARSSNNDPQVIGFGVVQGNFLKTISNFNPPGELGSLRKLSPFFPLSREPKGLHLMNVLGHKMALRELNEKRENDKIIIDWLSNRLVATRGGEQAPPVTPNIPNSRRSWLLHQSELEYEVRSKSEVVHAKRREAELVNAYQRWIEVQERRLEVASFNGLRCDVYEQDRQNLLEAKCSTKREYIRMAVGQLLEYGFLMAAGSTKPHLAVLLPEKPTMEKLAWLSEYEISIVWREKGAFLDNADGLFT